MAGVVNTVMLPNFVRGKDTKMDKNFLAGLIAASIFILSLIGLGAYRLYLDSTKYSFHFDGNAEVQRMEINGYIEIRATDNTLEIILVNENE